MSNNTYKKIPIELLQGMASSLKVLAHPDRLRIVEFLESEVSATVTQIHRALKLSQAATSQHLNYMKRAGLLSSTRKGKEVWYKIADPGSLTILNCIRKKRDSM